MNKSDLEGFETEYLVVDFRSVYSVPFNFLIDLAKSRGKRLRLLPPHREHLSQAFARFFMRVGLQESLAGKPPTLVLGSVKNKVKEKYLCVVVKLSIGDLFIITSYFKDMVKKGDVLWERR